MSEMNKCPYCGGPWPVIRRVCETYELSRVFVESNNYYNVQCACGVSGPKHQLETKAISLWNMMQVKEYEE